MYLFFGILYHPDLQYISCLYFMFCVVYVALLSAKVTERSHGSEDTAANSSKSSLSVALSIPATSESTAVRILFFILILKKNFQCLI